MFYWLLQSRFTKCISSGGLNTADTWGEMNLFVGGVPMCRRIFSNIRDLHTLTDGMMSPSTVTTKAMSRLDIVTLLLRSKIPPLLESNVWTDEDRLLKSENDSCPIIILVTINIIGNCYCYKFVSVITLCITCTKTIYEVHLTVSLSHIRKLRWVLVIHLTQVFTAYKWQNPCLTSVFINSSIQQLSLILFS